MKGTTAEKLQRIRTAVQSVFQVQCAVHANVFRDGTTNQYKAEVVLTHPRVNRHWWSFDATETKAIKRLVSKMRKDFQKEITLRNRARKALL